MFFDYPFKNYRVITFLYEKFFHSAYSKDELVEVCSFGTRILVPGKDITILPSLINHTFENELLKFISKYLKPGMTFVDVGANVGIHSSLAAKCLRGNGRIIAFEPIPENYELLVRNVNENIEVRSQLKFLHERIAISDQEGTSLMFLDENSVGTHSMYESKLSGQNVIEVSTTTLDSWFSDSQSKVDILKIDIEGHELSALIGARLTLMNTDLVLLEFDVEHFDNELKIRNLLELVNNFNYFYLFDETRRKTKKIYSSDLFNLTLCNNILISREEIKFLN